MFRFARQYRQFTYPSRYITVHLLHLLCFAGFLYTTIVHPFRPFVVVSSPTTEASHRHGRPTVSQAEGNYFFSSNQSTAAHTSFDQFRNAAGFFTGTLRVCAFKHRLRSSVSNTTSRCNLIGSSERTTNLNRAVYKIIFVIQITVVPALGDSWRDWPPAMYGNIIKIIIEMK